MGAARSCGPAARRAGRHAGFRRSTIPPYAGWPRRRMVRWSAGRTRSPQDRERTWPTMATPAPLSVAAVQAQPRPAAVADNAELAATLIAQSSYGGARLAVLPEL